MIERNRSVELIQPPSECRPDQLDAFVDLVSQGGQTRTGGLRERIKRAHWLGFHYEDDDLAAVAALKRPAEGYRETVFRKAQAQLPGDAFLTELGWVVTREPFRGRGISHRLLERLLQKGGQANLFATTRTDNQPMLSLLRSLGFQRVGRPFSGTNRTHQLQLWVRGHP